MLASITAQPAPDIKKNEPIKNSGWTKLSKAPALFCEPVGRAPAPKKQEQGPGIGEESIRRAAFSQRDEKDL
jgi:hypothetical protein